MKVNSKATPAIDEYADSPVFMKPPKLPKRKRKKKSKIRKPCTWDDVENLELKSKLI